MSIPEFYLIIIIAIIISERKIPVEINQCLQTNLLMRFLNSSNRLYKLIYCHERFSIELSFKVLQEIPKITLPLLLLHGELVHIYIKKKIHILIHAYIQTYIYLYIHKNIYTYTYINTQIRK